MLMAVLWPALSVRGKVGPVTVKYCVDTEAALTEADACPLLVTETVRVLLLPAVMVPKLRLPTPSAKLPLGGGWLELPAALTPWHPVSEMTPAKTSKIAAAEKQGVEHSRVQLFFIVCHGAHPEDSDSVGSGGKAHFRFWA
ncbi:MAG TPA: hypothetical protein VGS27_21785 [Candidatus Sulfotelmatobacter sp.]|nr:hypothetical protein [Candidatus Sulfotelmatobacter sp.]